MKDSMGFLRSSLRQRMSPLPDEAEFRITHTSNPALSQSTFQCNYCFYGNGPTMFSRSATAFGIICLLLNSLWGCREQASGPVRYELKGTVTYNNQPVPAGEMVFSPDSAAGNSGPGSVALIENGKYSIPRNQGVVGGPYVVTIHGFTAPPSAAAVPEPGTSDSKQLFTTIDLKQELPPKGGSWDFVIPIP